MDTAGSASRVSAGLESLWGYDHSRDRDLSLEASPPDNRPHLRLRIVAVLLLFAVMGATLAWVFESVSSDVSFMSYGGFSSSTPSATGQVTLTGN